MVAARSAARPGLTGTNEIENLRKRVTELEQQLLDYKQDLQDRDDELAAAAPPTGT